MQAAIHYKYPAFVKHLIKGGVDLSFPPQEVPCDNFDPECSLEYRKTPFMLQAAIAGNVEVIKALEAAG